MKYFIAIFFCIFILQSPIFSAKSESEHPPLSEDTKKAIAIYKRNPNEANKQNLLNALNKSYDAVIEQKKKNLNEHIKDKDKTIKMWLKTVKSGKNPPFMNLETDNNKGNERKAVANAIANYNKNRNAQNENALNNALSLYYEAFLDEQRKHIKETEDLREERINASLERFTSDRFELSPKSSQNSSKNLNKDEILAEVIANYINMGAEILPVNPEARVRERKFNASINEAQKNYFQNPNSENKSKLRNEIAKAFETALEVRIQSVLNSQNKGVKGGEKLLEKMQDRDFLQTQFSEITEQRNLYGRIDRIVSFGSNTASDWNPREKQDSLKLASAIKSGDKNVVRSEFNALYQKMLKVQKELLDSTKKRLDSLIDDTLNELIR